MKDRSYQFFPLKNEVWNILLAPPTDTLDDQLFTMDEVNYRMNPAAESTASPRRLSIIASDTAIPTVRRHRPPSPTSSHPATNRPSISSSSSRQVDEGKPGGDEEYGDNGDDDHENYGDVHICDGDASSTTSLRRSDRLLDLAKIKSGIERMAMMMSASLQSKTAVIAGADVSTSADRTSIRPPTTAAATREASDGEEVRTIDGTMHLMHYLENIYPSIDGIPTSAQQFIAYLDALGVLPGNKTEVIQDD